MKLMIPIAGLLALMTGSATAVDEPVSSLGGVRWIEASLRSSFVGAAVSLPIPYLLCLWRWLLPLLSCISSFHSSCYFLVHAVRSCPCARQLIDL